MDAQDKSIHTWVRLGAVYGAVVDDKLAAIVYHAEARRGLTGGPGGNGTTVDPAWYLVWAHEPHKHFQLSSPPRTAEMTSDQLEDAAFVALSEAGKIIDDQLAPDS
ncbi:MAG: hypothetical protein ACREX8_00555 [Gammaproteobacteria bacterium]